VAKTEFVNKVLRTISTIPRGTVVSYGQIALMADAPRAARQIGWILSSHGGEKGVPWWRVINNSGRISIKHKEYLPIMQKELLEKEGIKVSKDFVIDIEKYRYRPNK